MRTTLNLDDDLMKTAREFTGIESKTELIHKALREMVEWEAMKAVAAMGGSQPDFTLGPVRSHKKKKR